MVSAEEPVEKPGQELTLEREPVLDQRPADEEEPIDEEENESAKKDPQVKTKPAFNLPEVSLRLNHMVFNPEGSTKATKKKAEDNNLKLNVSLPEKRRRIPGQSTRKGTLMTVNIPTTK